ncbi:MAG: protein kinase [Actinobacteria bacterium]|nr:protein kinase [Actinomycetota bacterium]
MPSELDTLAERYVLESPIASGGMGTVWHARDQVLARPVAVKILNHDLAEDEAFVARFRREALAAARLTHPHIVAIYDTGVETAGGTDRHFIVMEHCGGGTLTELTASEGRLDPNRIIDIGVDICSALGHAHRHGVIHRDVKPANILFTPDGGLKVGDFGIAKAAFSDAEITTTGMILGTVTYISPEQANGDEPDGRSDLYSLGVILYELLTGRPPFQADSQIATAMKHVREEPPDPRSIRAGIPKGLAAVVLKALAKSPDDRYDSAEDLSEALRSSARRGGGGRGGGGDTAVLRRPATPTAPVPSAAPPEPSPRRARRSGEPSTSKSDYRWLIPLLIVAVVAAALALILPRVLDDSPGDANPGGGGTGSTAAALEVPAPVDFDPEGGDGEHPELTAAVVDGDPATQWTTSNYNDALNVTKSGVGLLFDLGEATEVSAIEVTGNIGSFEIRAGDDDPQGATDLGVVGAEGQLSGTTEVTLDQPVTARYWLVWITALPGGGGGSAQIGEVGFFGP